MPSEFGSYRNIKSTIEQAEDMGFKLEWYSDCWKLEVPGVAIVRGHTSTELLCYLNGWRDHYKATVLKRSDGKKVKAT